jgi:hypothetical protein
MRMGIGIVILIAIMFSGCAKKPVQQTSKLEKSEHISHKKHYFDECNIQRQEAALLDIAIPTYQERLPIYCEDQYTGQVVLGYHSDCAPEDHRQFFHEQMERYGWNLRREFKGSELFLEFEKPTRSCAVSLRPRSSGFFNKRLGTDIVIYVEDSSVVY